jgi:hypothetical protein
MGTVRREYNVWLRRWFLRGITLSKRADQEIVMEKIARAASIAAVLLAAGSVPASAQREGPWCAHVGIGDDSYIERCDMLSYEMCRQEIFAQGGAYCTQNPRYKPTAPSKVQRKTQKRDTR